MQSPGRQGHKARQRAGGGPHTATLPYYLPLAQPGATVQRGEWLRPFAWRPPRKVGKGGICFLLLQKQLPMPQHA